MPTVNGETQIKASEMPLYKTLIVKAKIQKTDHFRRWQGCGTRAVVHGQQWCEWCVT